MSQLQIDSFRNKDNPRDSEYYAELAKNISEIVIERATDGNPVCIEIFEKARRAQQKK
jgi:hypothetical protein